GPGKFGLQPDQRIPAGSTALIEEVRFAADSPLEEGVLSELVSEPKFPASWENTGNFVRRGLRVRTTGSKSSIKFNGLRANSLRIGTGNLFRPSRELNPGHQGINSPDQGIP